jgi:hypothetical protein
LEPPKHRAPTVDKNFALKEAGGDGNVANKIAGTLYSVDAQSHVDAAFFAARDDLKEMAEVESLCAGCHAHGFAWAWERRAIGVD